MRTNNLRIPQLDVRKCVVIQISMINNKHLQEDAVLVVDKPDASSVNGIEDNAGQSQRLNEIYSVESKFRTFSRVQDHAWQLKKHLCSAEATHRVLELRSQNVQCANG